MRITDNRYASEMHKFNLAIRMIGHEARTGTIRKCTGFSEDRIRKIYSTYFKQQEGNRVKRRRGKSPTQISAFIKNIECQSQATVLACLFLYCGVVRMEPDSGALLGKRLNPVDLGEAMCEAFETYCSVHPHPGLCFERAWNLYSALALEQELFFAKCDDCGGPYVQDRYALDYRSCPFCQILQTN